MKILNNLHQMGLSRDSTIELIGAIQMFTLSTAMAKFKDRKQGDAQYVKNAILNQLQVLLAQPIHSPNVIELDGHAKEFDTLYRQASTHQVNPSDLVQMHGWNYDGQIFIPMYELQLSCFLIIDNCNMNAKIFLFLCLTDTFYTCVLMLQYVWVTKMM